MTASNASLRGSLWNERYQVMAEASDQVPPSPCDCLSRYSALLPAQGKALDLASGRGGNALLLAAAGLEAHAWDQADVALTQCRAFAESASLTVHTRTVDVVAAPPEPLSFDVIVVSRFLDRALAPALINALRPQGLLFYQTFVVGNRHGPSNPDYLLKPNELLTLFSGLQIRAYQESGVLESEPSLKKQESVQGSTQQSTQQSEQKQGADRQFLLHDEAFLIGQK